MCIYAYTQEIKVKKKIKAKQTIMGKKSLIYLFPFVSFI